MPHSSRQEFLLYIEVKGHGVWVVGPRKVVARDLNVACLMRRVSASLPKPPPAPNQCKAGAENVTCI